MKLRSFDKVASVDEGGARSNSYERVTSPTTHASKMGMQAMIGEGFPELLPMREACILHLELAGRRHAHCLQWYRMTTP